MPGRALLLGAILTLGACGRLLPGGVRCPEHGGASWHAYRTRHFVVYTDLDRDQGVSLARQLETLRAMELRVLAGDGREVPGRLRVVVPAERATYLAIAPPGVLGYYLVSGLGEPTIVLHPAALRSDPEVPAHELAHHLAWLLYPRQPRWFTEGLAQFVQTVANPDPALRGTAGLVPRVRAGRLSAARQVPARELLAWRGAADRDQPDRHDIWAWVLYEWLRSARPEGLVEYERRLSLAEDPSLAWAAAFPELDPAHEDALERLDGELDAFRRAGAFPTKRVSADAAAAVTEAAVPSADVHVLLVEARGYWTVSRHRLQISAADALEAAARPQLEEARREDPLQPRALSRLSELEGVPAAPGLRAAAATRPDDWSVWFLLGDALEDEGDAGAAESAYRRAVELEPDGSPALNNLAWLLATSGRIEEASPFARRAAALAPWSADVLDTLALVEDGLGSCPEVLTLQRRAVDLLEREDPEIRGRLVDYERGCGEGAPRETPPPQAP